MKPRLLDLFCGAGGCSVGYQRAGFSPYGIDNNPKPLRHYPFPYVCMDALGAMDRLLAGEGLTFSNGETLYLADSAAFHASPPCQEYSFSFNIMSNFSKNRYPKVLNNTRTILSQTSKPFVIENVIGAKYRKNQTEGLQAHYLCGTMFEKKYHRHRLFETSFLWLSPGKCRGKVTPGYGTGIKNRTMTLSHNSKVIVAAAMEQFEIDWMANNSELTQAIPPAYTEYIGKYLMEVVRKKR